MLGFDLPWLVALTIGLISFYLVKYFIDIRAYPPGPLPVPFIGNILIFLRNKKNPAKVFEDLKKRYNGIYTLWAGSVPAVFVCNWELIKEGLVTNRNHIFSRPNFQSLRHNKYHTVAISFQGNTKQWEVCRKVGHTAVRKFADSEVLATIVQRNAEEMIGDMLSEKVAFNPKPRLQKFIFNIISQTAFGVDELTEAERQIMMKEFDLFHESMTISPGDFSPILYPFFRKFEKTIQNAAEAVGAFLSDRLKEIKKDYNSDELRHFTDSVIASGIEAESEESENKIYLTDRHLQGILGDLFLAGTDATTTAITWVFEALAAFPEIQEKIREEIDDNIGSSLPTVDRRKDCPYTWAFISECLRYKPPLSVLVPHATNVNTSIGGKKIPNGTIVFFDITATHFDPNLWEEPLKFKPERFLDSDGKYVSKKIPGYLPFGEGKRMCIGEKLARNDLFLIIANVTRKVRIVASKNADKMQSENNPFFNLPADFEINVLPR